MTDTNLTGKVVYVAGPMTDNPRYEYEFEQAWSWLRSHGASHVTTPTRIVAPARNRAEAMRECAHELTKRSYDAHKGELVRRPFYDLVVLLDGWESSAGARFEREVAEACGIAVVEMGELRWDEK
jgi:hypothetical protein